MEELLRRFMYTYNFALRVVIIFLSTMQMLPSIYTGAINIALYATHLIYTYITILHHDYGRDKSFFCAMH